jgi:hypothetical protein
MSLNLGTPACEAMRELRSNPHWLAIRTTMLEQSRAKMNIALESPPGGARDDAVGYARALRDLVVSFEAATTGSTYQRTEKPGPIEGKPNAAR